MLLTIRNLFFLFNQLRVDREFFIFYASIDENDSWYIDDNIRRYTRNASLDKDDADFVTSNQMKGKSNQIVNSFRYLSWMT